MAISYNTGTTGHITAAVSNAGGTLTIPAGVLTGDDVFVLIGMFTEVGTSPVLSLTSSATSPTLVGSQQQVTGGAFFWTTGVWHFTAGGSDAGATLTYSSTNGATNWWWDIGLVSYTGANGIDVHQAGTSTYTASGSTGTLTSVSATTGVSGDWQIQFVTSTVPSTNDYATPGGLTSRQTILNAANSGVLLAIADSNASVGGSGTTIGNSTWTASGGGTGSSWTESFTIGLKPPAGAAVTGTVQPRATVPVPRRTLARAVWRGSVPFTGFVAVAAPRQIPQLLPRRMTARSVVRGTLVSTTNAAQVLGPAGQVPTLMVNRTEVISRVTGRVIRR